MKRIYTINTVNNFMEIIYQPFGLPFAEAHKDSVEFYNIMDDSLLKDTLAAGKVTDKVADRMVRYALAAEASGADAVLVTCTSVNDGVKAIRENVKIPAINIAEPTALEAMNTGKRIGVLGTLPTSPAAIGGIINYVAEKEGKEVELVPYVVDGAFDILCAGDRDKHDEMVNEGLLKLAKDVDAIVFAQISMSMLNQLPVDIPVCKIGTAGFEEIYKLAGC